MRDNGLENLTFTWYTAGKKSREHSVQLLNKFVRKDGGTEEEQTVENYLEKHKTELYRQIS